MMPMHGGVPNFSLKIPGPIKVLLALILVPGLLLSLSFYLSIEPGDVAAENRFKLSLIITLMLAFFVFVAGTQRWWFKHLRKHGNSQSLHRRRIQQQRHQNERDRHHHRRRR